MKLTGAEYLRDYKTRKAAVGDVCLVEATDKGDQTQAERCLQRRQIKKDDGTTKYVPYWSTGLGECNAGATCALDPETQPAHLQRHFGSDDTYTNKYPTKRNVYSSKNSTPYGRQDPRNPNVYASAGHGGMVGDTCSFKRDDGSWGPYQCLVQDGNGEFKWAENTHEQGRNTCNRVCHMPDEKTGKMPERETSLLPSRYVGKAPGAQNDTALITSTSDNIDSLRNQYKAVEQRLTEMQSQLDNLLTRQTNPFAPYIKNNGPSTSKYYW